MLKTFQTCPVKFWYKYVKMLNVPQKSSVFEKGKKVHALANYYLRGDNIEKLEKTLTEEEYELWSRLKNNEYFQKKYINSEYNLSAKIDKYWVGGRLDALVEDENNIYILDYKTGSVPKDAQNDYQTQIYLVCVSEFYKNTDKKISFVYIDLKNNRNYTIDFDDDKKERYIASLIKICKNIEENKCIVHNSVNKTCEYCEYKKFCFNGEDYE